MRHLKKFENYNNIEVEQSGGLSCDNPSCDWEDASISTDDYKNWVNKGCPKCGQSVLSEEDYNKTMQLISAINLINSIPPEQLAELTKNMDSDDIIDAYLKLKDFGLNHKGGENWEM